MNIHLGYESQSIVADCSGSVSVPRGMFSSARASVICFLAIVFLLASCKNPPTGPPPPPPPVESDTTSHEFVWQINTLGDGSSSTLYDAAIINDSLIYVVGEIYFRDDPTPYCLAIWNGVEWKLKRLYYYNPAAQATLRLSVVYGILAFSATDVWLGPGSVFHWNGRDSMTTFSFNRLTLPDPYATVLKFWGTSSSNLYGVGGAGTIVHYNGSTWRKIESGTTLDIRDIWGKDRVYAVASAHGETKILAVSNQFVVDSVAWPVTYHLHGLWISESSTMYLAGNGIWKYSGSTWQLLEGVPQTIYYTASVRGNADNDIFTGAWGGVLMHYNGRSWHTYTEIASDFSFVSLAVKGNTVVAVGFTGGVFVDKAAVVIGRRLP